MCAIVVVEDVGSKAPRWDRDRVALIINEGLSYSEALKQIRALLAFLGALQVGLEATCWCGDHVPVPEHAVRVPHQRTTSRQEGIRHAS